MGASHAGSDSATIDLGVMAGAIHRGSRGIVIAALLGALVGLVWGLIAAPVYEVKIIAAPVEPEMEGAGALSGQVGLASLVGMRPAGRVSRKDEAIAIFNSQSFLYAFVTELNLMPLLFGDRSGVSWRSLVGLEKKPPRLADAFRLLQDEVLSIAEERRSGLVEITVRWRDPEITAAWARELISRLNTTMQARAQERAIREMDFLRTELKRTDTVEVKQAVFRLMESQLKTLMLANVSDNFALRVIDPPIAPDPEDDVGLSLTARVAVGLLSGALLWLAVVIGRELRRAIGTAPH
jgi:uncharacterized protein involved in exopolysaccharide biosynthesis